MQNCTPAQDLLVVCGETYLNLCRSFMQSSVDGSIDSLANVVQVSFTAVDVHCTYSILGTVHPMQMQGHLMYIIMCIWIVCSLGPASRSYVSLCPGIVLKGGVSISVGEEYIF